MSSRSRTIAGIVVMSLVLILYFALTGVRAIALLRSADVVATIMGIAMLILPLIGAWALWRELLFGVRANHLADRLEAEGCLPEERVATHSSGRPVREDADAAFPRYRDEATAEPDSWRAWMRLGIVYDACGDRKRARGAIREAIALERGRTAPELER